VAVAYLSPKWLEEARKQIEASKEFREAAKGLELSMVNVVTDAPGGKTLYIRYAFADGEIQDLKLGSDPKITDAGSDFKVTASYETFASLTQGKTSIAQAFLARKLKLEGSLPRAMKFVKPLDVMNRVLRKVPTVY
jgi:putative sterol carrier protein